MIRSFRHKGLKDLFLKGQSSRVRPDLQARCLSRLDAIERAESMSDLNVTGFGLHALKGAVRRYSIKVNGPWRITFEWDGHDAIRVDLEQYH